MTTVNAMMQFQGFLTWYFGMKLGLLGVYSVGRSAEKIGDATGGAGAPAWLDTLIKAIKGKK
jgi:hypothetical protein